MVCSHINYNTIQYIHTVKNPNWPEANQLAIYKCSWEVEPGNTRIEFNESVWVLNPGSPDLKASALTIGPHLSKDFDSLPHKLLPAKRVAYGLNKEAVALLKDYLHGRQQWVKIGDMLSTYGPIWRNSSSELATMVNWYAVNGLKANPEKFQAMILGKKKQEFVFEIGNVAIQEKGSIDFLGVNLDNK